MKKPNHPPKGLIHEIVGLSLLAAAALVFLCLLNPSLGILGNYTNKFLKLLAGEGRYLFPLSIGVVGLTLLRRRKKNVNLFKIYGFILLFVVVLVVLHLPIPVEYALQAGIDGDGGGLIGGLGSFLCQKSFGPAGAYIILLTLFIMGVLIITNRSFFSIIMDAYKKIINGFKKGQEQIGNFIYQKEVAEKKIPEKNSLKECEPPNGPLIVSCEHNTNDFFAEQTATLDSQKQGNMQVIPSPGMIFTCKRPGLDEQKSVIASISPLNDENNGDKNKEKSNYCLPPLDILTKPVKIKGGKGNMNISENVQKLEKTLESFGVKGKVSKVVCGPTITRYEFHPPTGIKVSKIMSLADDIALSMAALDVRIEAPIPGKSAVGIEMPNKEISGVFLWELVKTKEFAYMPSKLALALGKDVAGMPVIADLAKMPHLLIAGATGSGKSVCLNTIISSILFKALPHEVKFLIIDPKMVELTMYNGIPHLVSPVVTDPKKAAISLRWAVKEMEHRYKLFAGAGVRDIYRYNKLMKAEGSGRLVLPLMMIIIDELADLMMVAPADIEETVSRLAQMSRAAGMHLVIATQRPSVDVITGLIKANIPSRISFAVSSQIDSRTILDLGGAEKLLGKGDMLFFPVGASKPVRVQAAFLFDRDVDNLVNFLRKQGTPKYIDGFLDIQQCESNKGFKNDLNKNSGDELFPKAVELIMESGQASITMLQRRLHIGYARAARLIDMLETKGIVGGYEGSKPRAVLVTREQYDQIKNHK